MDNSLTRGTDVRTTNGKRHIDRDNQLRRIIELSSQTEGQR